MKKFTFWFSIFILLLLTGCNSPELSNKKVKREYFTGGKIRSEFFMNDNTKQNGLLKKYGYNGHLTSTVPIRNGVKHGTEIGYDDKGRVIWKLTFVNGKQEGKQYAYYSNGDIMISYTYVHGVKNGPAKTYNKDGSVNKRVIYKNDRIIN